MLSGCSPDIEVQWMVTKILDTLDWMGMLGSLQKGECFSTFCVNRALYYFPSPQVKERIMMCTTNKGQQQQQKIHLDYEDKNIGIQCHIIFTSYLRTRIFYNFEGWHANDHKLH